MNLNKKVLLTRDKYLKNKEYWDSKMKKIFVNPEKKIRIFNDIISNSDLRIKDISKKYNVTDSRIYQILKEVTDVIEEKKIFTQRDTMHNYIDEEEYKEIKEMFYQGYDMQDIINKTGRSSSTLSIVRESKDLADHKRITKELKHRYSKSKNPQPKTISNSIDTVTSTDVQINLDAFRERFDKVLIDFIISEVQKKYKELIDENAQLKQRLKIAEPSFSNRVKEEIKILTPSQATGEEKKME